MPMDHRGTAALRDRDELGVGKLAPSTSRELEECSARPDLAASATALSSWNPGFGSGSAIVLSVSYGPTAGDQDWRVRRSHARGWSMRLEATQQRFRDLVRLLQSEEYFAAASEQRFRAVERRLSWQASRVAMLVIALGAPVRIAVLSLFHPADAAYIAIVDGGLGTVALGAWWSLGRWLRHWPEPVAFVLSLAVADASMLLAVTGPPLVELTIGYLLFLPTFAALVLPWRSW